MRIPSDALGAVINLNGGDSGKKSVVQVQPYDGDEEEDRGVAASAAPPPDDHRTLVLHQPQKIAKQEAKAVQPETAAKISLVPYYDGEDDVSSAVFGTRSSLPPQALASSANALAPSSSFSTMPPSSFYGNGNATQSSKKRKGQAMTTMQGTRQTRNVRGPVMIQEEEEEKAQPKNSPPQLALVPPGLGSTQDLQKAPRATLAVKIARDGAGVTRARDVQIPRAGVQQREQRTRACERGAHY
ncbi:hypothetical protein BU17DRAFT_94135 [Hysterangium stoloniferum]|nr:hypothetical protein BU17DRAFT_94135 [Hysterangium stoloniferum]